MLMLFGDHVEQHSRWAACKKIDMAHGDAVKAATGRSTGSAGSGLR
jgi:hypothetical protein